MIHMTIDMPEEALAALRTDPASFARELRLAAAVKWYEMRRVSQGLAAEIAGLSRTEFLDALGTFGVSPFQYTAAEALVEADDRCQFSPRSPIGSGPS
jgi:predicted HTH domain antitoxin